MTINIYQKNIVTLKYIPSLIGNGLQSPFLFLLNLRFSRLFLPILRCFQTTAGDLFRTYQFNYFSFFKPNWILDLGFFIMKFNFLKKYFHNGMLLRFKTRKYFLPCSKFHSLNFCFSLRNAINFVSLQMNTCLNSGVNEIIYNAWSSHQS